MLKTRPWIVIAMILGCLVSASGPATLAGGETPDSQSPEPQSQEPAESAAPEATPAAEPAEMKKADLDGAKVYAWNCGTCHSERYPNERSDAKWEQITTHMRVRANLTADQAEAVLRYLQENNK